VERSPLGIRILVSDLAERLTQGVHHLEPSQALWNNNDDIVAGYAEDASRLHENPQQIRVVEALKR